MNDLIERLRTAIDEDERAALQCQEREWRIDGAKSCQVYVPRPDGSNRTIAWCRNGYDDDFSNVIHIANNDPARVLRQVAAMRKILDLHRAFSDVHPDRPGHRMCVGCGFAADDETGGYVIEDVEDCPIVLALADMYDIGVKV